MSYEPQILTSSIRQATSLKRKLTIKLKQQSPAAKMLERELRNAAISNSKCGSITPIIDTTQDSKRVVNDLIKQLNAQVQKRQKVESELKEWKERLVRKEIEFREIIARYQSDKMVVANPNLKILHDDIQQKLERSNAEAQKWLESKYKENFNLMERRVKQIKEHMQGQLSKHKKLSIDSYNEIMMEVEYTKNLAKSIDQENRKITKELRQLKFKNQVLVEERNMVIQEIIDKKNIIRQMVNEKQKYKEYKEKQCRPNTVSRFLGEPSIASPKRFTQRTIENIWEEPRVIQSEKRSINNLQRTLNRQKRKNHELSTLFSRNSKKNQQLNNILWQCIHQAKREAGNAHNEAFASKVIDNLVRSQKLIMTITDMRDTTDNTTRSPFFNNKGQTADVSMLFQSDAMLS